VPGPRLDVELRPNKFVLRGGLHQGPHLRMRSLAAIDLIIPVLESPSFFVFPAPSFPAVAFGSQCRVLSRVARSRRLEPTQVASSIIWAARGLPAGPSQIAWQRSRFPLARSAPWRKAKQADVWLRLDGRLACPVEHFFLLLALRSDGFVPSNCARRPTTVCRQPSPTAVGRP